MRTPEGEKILSVIRGHVGRENAISARDICLELGWSPKARERLVRRIVADESALWTVPGGVDAGRAAVLVCAAASRGDSGYFVAADFEEAETYYNWLLSLAAVANRKVFNFREACSKMGIKFAQQKAA